MSNENKHGAILIAAFVANSILNYGFSVMLSWYLNPAEFGMLGVAQSLLLLSGMAVGSGFAWTTAHDIALSGVCEESRQSFRSSWVANTSLGVFLAGAFWVMYTSRFFPFGPNYFLIILFVGLTTVLLAIRSVFTGALRGLFRFGSLSVNLVIEVVIKIGVGLALVVGGFGVPGVLIGFACGTLAALLHCLWMLKSERLWSWGGRFDRRVIWMTIPFFLGMVGPSLIMNLDILGLKLFAPASLADQMAGLYQGAAILARTPVFIAQALGMVFFSYALGRYAREGRWEVFDHLSAAMRAWLRLLLPIALGLILAPQAALTIFYPASYHQMSGTLQLAAAGGALLALAVLFTGILQATEDRFRPALVTTIAVMVQITVLVIALPQGGIITAALSLFAGGLVAVIGLMPSVYRLSKPSLPKPGISRLLHLARIGFPYACLAIPLLVLPDGGRAAQFLKFLIAGCGYCLALLLIHPVRSDIPDRPVKRQIMQLVNVLLGG